MGWCLEEDLLRVRENKDHDRALKDDSDWENFPGMGIHKSRKEKKKKKDRRHIMEEEEADLTKKSWQIWYIHDDIGNVLCKWWKFIHLILMGTLCGW